MAENTNSKYLPEFFRVDQDHLHLRRLLLKGAASAQAEPPDAAYFADYVISSNNAPK